MGELSLHPVGQDDVADILELISCSESHSIELTCDEKDASLSSESINDSKSTNSYFINQNSLRQDFESMAVKAILDEIFNNPYSEYKGFTIRCGNSAKNHLANVIVGFIFTR